MVQSSTTLLQITTKNLPNQHLSDTLSTKMYLSECLCRALLLNCSILCRCSYMSAWICLRAMELCFIKKVNTEHLWNNTKQVLTSKISALFFFSESRELTILNLADVQSNLGLCRTQTPCYAQACGILSWYRLQKDWGLHIAMGGDTIYQQHPSFTARRCEVEVANSIHSLMDFI